MHPAEESMQRAIQSIESFLSSNEEMYSMVTPERLQELSRNLQHAKAARDMCENLRPAAPAFTELCDRYRQSLERLRLRLAEIETNLKTERNRLLEDHSRLSQMRQWHSLLGRTQ